ncbi:MAG: hypothetical protein QXR58_01535 [Candidatus Micrarchaeaceae archaeon]
MAGEGKAYSMHKHRSRKAYFTALVVIVIIIIAAIVALSTSGFVQLSSQRNLYISGAPVLVDINGRYFSINLASHTSSGAKFYISQLPIFINPTMLVSVSTGNTTHIALGTEYANLGLRLNSVGNNSANVTLIPINPSLGVLADSGLIEYVYPLPISQNSSSGIKIIITNSTGLPSTITPTINTTTTIKPVNNTEKVMSVVERSIWYPLMLNYSKAYSNSAACTPQLYNSSYIAYYGAAPAGATTYQNESIFVPYKMNSSITSLGNDEYAYSYYTYAKSALATGKVLVLSVNISSMNITGTALSGIFKGDNYTALYNGYKKSAGIGNACGIEII